MDIKKMTASVKRKKGIETQENILKASALLFAEEGYDNVSIRQIASAVNIKESSIYNHFDSKESILKSLFHYFSNEVANARPGNEELEVLMTYMSPEEILKNMIFRVGQKIDKTLDCIATIIFVERFRHKDAAELYFNLIIEEQTDFYIRLFKLMGEKRLITLPVNECKEIAVQYNYVLVALANEFSMAKNGMADPMLIVKKMIEAASFFSKKLCISNGVLIK
jgi:AcrR family transcriptional regulator